MKMFKKTKWLMANLLLAVIAFSGCATFVSTAYKIDATTAAVVDTAMNAYGVLFRAGHISPATEATVKKAFEEYQVIMTAQIQAVRAYSALKDQGIAGPAELALAQNNTTKALADAAAAVVNLFNYLKGAGVAPSILNSVLTPK